MSILDREQSNRRWMLNVVGSASVGMVIITVTCMYVCMVFGVVWLYVKVLARVDACALCICVGGAVEREDRRSEQIR